MVSTAILTGLNSESEQGTDNNMLSGASPTSYFMWKQVLESKLNSESHRGRADSIVAVEAQCEVSTYNDLHACSFENMKDDTLSTMIESASLEVLNKQDHNGNTPLIWAASEGRYEVANALIEQGCDINTQNYNGETAIFLASARGHVRIVELLLINGANPHIVDLEGASPMHLAAANGRSDVLHVFATHAAFLNVTDNSGDSLLHYSIRGGHLDTLKFLVNGAKLPVDVLNEDEETPIDLASDLGESAMMDFLYSSLDM